MKEFRKLISLSTIYSIGNISEKALGFFLIPLYTAFLVPDDFGIIGLMSVAVSLLAIFVSGPISSALKRFYYEPNFRKQNKVLLFNFVVLVFIQISVITAVFYFLSTIIAASLLGNSGYDHIVKIYAAILFFWPFDTILRNLIRLQERARFYVAISIVKLLIRVGIILYLLIWLDLGIVAVIIGQLVGLIVAVVMIIPVLVKSMRFRLQFSILKKPLAYGYPLIIANYSTLLIQSGDRFVMKILSTLSNVGLYTFGYNFAGIISFLIIAPINQAITPIVLKLENQPERLKEFVRKGASYYYFAAVFLALAFSFFSYEVMQLMTSSDEFLASNIIVPMIAMSFVQYGLGNFLSWGLILKKKSYHITGILLFSAVLNIALNFILIPFFGIVGAALATFISYIVWNIVKAYISEKFYRIDFEWSRLVNTTVICIIIYIIYVYLNNLPLTLIGTISTKLVLLVLYISIILLMLHRDERSKIIVYLRSFR